MVGTPLSSYFSKPSVAQVLVQEGLITPAETHLPEDELISRVGQEAYYRALARSLGKTYIPPKDFNPDPEAYERISEKWLQKGLIPYSYNPETQTLLFATYDPRAVASDYQNLKSNLRNYDARIEYVTTKEVIERAARTIAEYKEAKRVKENLSSLQTTSGTAASETVDEDPYGTLGLLKSVFASAKESKVSDIHFERGVNGGRVRFREGGILREVRTYDFLVFNALIARLKVLAGLRLDEQRVPQDGRILLSLEEKGGVEGRLSVLPTVRGEEAVVRLLPPEGDLPSLDDLVADHEVRQAYKSIISYPYGIFLVTGPTGSGKTTTLAALIREIRARSQQKKVLTVEDPVEYRIPGVSQVQVNEAAGLTFARALRAFLRQDPDVILVGEIRDQETASVATQAALTGHLVLGTLHVNDAPSTIRRLEQMGVERYKIVDALLGASAQRLVPRLCPNCSIPDPSPPEGIEGARAPRIGANCPVCKGKGYVGRVSISEIFFLDEETRQKIALADDERLMLTLVSELKRRGFRTMYERGLEFVRSGAIFYEDLVEIVGKKKTDKEGEA